MPVICKFLQFFPILPITYFGIDNFHFTVIIRFCLITHHGIGVTQSHIVDSVELFSVPRIAVFMFFYIVINYFLNRHLVVGKIRRIVIYRFVVGRHQNHFSVKIQICSISSDFYKLSCLNIKYKSTGHKRIRRTHCKNCFAVFSKISGITTVNPIILPAWFWCHQAVAFVFKNVFIFYHSVILNRIIFNQYGFERIVVGTCLVRMNVVF